MEEALERVETATLLPFQQRRDVTYAQFQQTEADLDDQEQRLEALGELIDALDAPGNPGRLANAIRPVILSYPANNRRQSVLIEAGFDPALVHEPSTPRRPLVRSLPERDGQGARAALRPEGRRPALARRGHHLDGHGSVRRPQRRQGHVLRVLRRLGLSPGPGQRDGAGHVARGELRPVWRRTSPVDPTLARRSVGEGGDQPRPRPWNHRHPPQQRPAVFEAAVRDRVIQTDPTDGVAPPRRRRNEAALTLPISEQVGTLTGVAEEPFRPMLALAAFAGLRVGEICAVQLGDVEFLGRRLQVRRQVQRENGGGVGYDGGFGRSCGLPANRRRTGGAMTSANSPGYTLKRNSTTSPSAIT